MSGKIEIREFSIDDYDAAINLWQRVEGLEIAEGDDREGVAQFLAQLTTDQGSESLRSPICAKSREFLGSGTILSASPVYAVLL